MVQPASRSEVEAARLSERQAAVAGVLLVDHICRGSLILVAGGWVGQHKGDLSGRAVAMQRLARLQMRELCSMRLVEV